MYSATLVTECMISLVQNQIYSKAMTRHEQESAALQERLQNALSHSKNLQSQLSEMKRKQAESDCKVLYAHL